MNFGTKKKLVENPAAGFHSGDSVKAGETHSLKMDVETLQALASDRPLRSREIYGPNDFYGHATILKNYAKSPQKETIKAAIEHGLYFGGHVWDSDINCRLPAVFTCAQSRFPYLRRATKKKLFAIGPLLAYAPHLLKDKALQDEKQRLGRNLLSFPSHSTHHVDSHFDVDEYCRHLREIGKDFDTVRVCLYWKDVLRGFAKDFSARGFECVTAGHIFDPLFLSRLKSIIECATVTTSNELGTHLGYSVFMGKPHCIVSSKVSWTAKTNDIIRDAALERLELPDVLKVKKAFSEWRNDISSQQKDIVEEYWGITEFKSEKELRNIFAEINDLYKKQNLLSRLRNRAHVMRRRASILTWTSTLELSPVKQNVREANQNNPSQNMRCEETTV